MEFRKALLEDVEETSLWTEVEGTRAVCGCACCGGGAGGVEQARSEDGLEGRNEGLARGEGD